MIKKLLRKFGYIHEGELIKQAVDLYILHDTTTEDLTDFYYDCGNQNALNALLSRLGINLTDYIKSEFAKRERWVE